MNTNTQSTVPALHCLTYRFKGDSVSSTLIASMAEIEQFIDDVCGLSSTHKLNLALSSFRPKALTGVKPALFPTVDPFIERQVFPVQTEVNSEKYRMIRTEEPIKHSGSPKRHIGVKNIVPPMVLNTQTMCVCPQTGIGFTVSLPSPMGLGLTIAHPFSQYSNVVEFIRSYQEHGKDIADLESQVLAGMLITVGRHKGYYQVNKSISANIALRACSVPLLIRALNYFYRKGNNNGFYPVLSLDTNADPSFSILQHIKICEGEDTSITIRTLSNAKKTVRAKIYTDKNKQQFTQAKADIKSARHILDGLRKRFKDSVDAAVFENIETQIDGIIFVTEEQKRKVCQFIYDVFAGDEGAKSIIILLRSIETDAVESDLLSLSQEIEIEQSEGTEQKLSLSELLAKAKQKGNA